MNDIEIEQAIQLLSKNGFRTASAVRGEYVEKYLARQLDADAAKHCQKGFDMTSKEFGKIEVKSRDFYARSHQCNLPEHKIEAIDNFILVIVNKGVVDKALMFSKERLNSYKKGKNGVVTINSKKFGDGEDITRFLKNGISESGGA